MDDGVSLGSIAHPRPSWWRRLLFRIRPHKFSANAVEYTSISIPLLRVVTEEEVNEAIRIAKKYKIVSETSEIIR